MSSHHQFGVDVIGANAPGAPSPSPPVTQKLLTIHVKNALDLAKANGVTGAIAATLAPGPVENLVYNKMAADLGPALKEKGVDAEIAVIEGPVGSPQPTKFTEGVFVGTGVAVGTGGLLWLISHLFPRRK